MAEAEDKAKEDKLAVAKKKVCTRTSPVPCIDSMILTSGNVYFEQLKEAERQGNHWNQDAIYEKSMGLISSILRPSTCSSTCSQELSAFLKAEVVRKASYSGLLAAQSDMAF